MEIMKKVAHNLKQIRYHESIHDNAKLAVDIKTFLETALVYKPTWNQQDPNEQRWNFQLKTTAADIEKKYPDRFKPSEEHLHEILTLILNVYKFLLYDQEGKVGMQLSTVDPNDSEKVQKKLAESTQQLESNGKKVLLVNIGKSQITNQPSLIINFIDAADDTL